MGLNFSRSTARWTYSGFAFFRRRLAGSIGVDLNQMQGFIGPDDEELGHAISWSTVSDPIVPLLDHSDCDGSLSPHECLCVGLRLVQIINDWEEDDRDRMEAEVFAQDLIECGRNGEAMEFC